MKNETVKTAARKPLILRGDSVEVTLCAVDVYHVAGRAGNTTGYAVGGVYRKGAPGKSGEARSQLHALERILVLLGVDAIAKTELNRYRRVYNTAEKAARACEEFSEAYDCALGENAARIIAEAEASTTTTEKEVTNGGKSTPSAKDIIDTAVAKACKRSTGCVPLALLAAVRVGDIPKEALDAALKCVEGIAAAISETLAKAKEAEEAKAKAEAEAAEREIAEAEAALAKAKEKAAKKVAPAA